MYIVKCESKNYKEQTLFHVFLSYQNDIKNSNK